MITSLKCRQSPDHGNKNPGSVSCYKQFGSRLLAYWHDVTNGHFFPCHDLSKILNFLFLFPGLKSSGKDGEGGLLGLPESETELENLTEFNTAHNRRITMLGKNYTI